jgi:hypothetical protein
VIVVFVQGVVVPLSDQAEDGTIEDEIAPARDEDGKPEKLAGNDQEALDPHTPIELLTGAASEEEMPADDEP